MSHVSRAAAAAAVVALAATFAQAQTGNPYTNGIAPAPFSVPLRNVATVPSSGGGPARMNFVGGSPDGRTFALDQRGPLYRIGASGPGGATNSSLYLDLRAGPYASLNLLADAERGAASFAFHPNFNGAVGTPGRGKLYVAFSTGVNGTTPAPTFASPNGDRVSDEVVYELTTTNPLAPTFVLNGSPRQVIRQADPFSNHNGGGLGFNPNSQPGSADYGKLYYSSGDAGSGGDPLNVAQNLNSPLGKILRVDPLGTNGTGGGYGIAADNAFAADGNAGTLAEVYAAGFRNPQRFNWDRGGTGKMFAGDIGQGVLEEIDVVVNGGNYGWRVREGSYQFVNGGTVTTPANPNDSQYVNPVAEYDHSEGQAVSGGDVYRATDVPNLFGKYVFGDLANGRVFIIDANGATPVTNVGQGQGLLSEIRFNLNGSAAAQTFGAIVDAARLDAAVGRADLRLGIGGDGVMYLLNKHDNTIRAIGVIPEPGTVVALAGVGALALARKRR